MVQNQRDAAARNAMMTVMQAQEALEKGDNSAAISMLWENRATLEAPRQAVDAPELDKVMRV